ncbi:hypothetical protein PGUG_01605 [Meyerozyma guilliermondii ATCC 6260]|uniref:Oligomycin resistance ATP-dependent permease YOR1 n=1 Tax=Meyerozyma guilliermondii (strain ATCC 6260 / CBS 566 / DSM 6381 / JCM 1539 / NBRC 10279 / NRRL Y-324) TaxID=294746 RepID=A5DEA4_PICGU|nr:uncharacterized protein PGUG_01605 [Meyerozyma guilliermondii ATCC 6260]EDK37507.2 hypothetical protein PGUG_01605 [Meyerozyma guilliermondii ATCC 6260]
MLDDNEKIEGPVYQKRLFTPLLRKKQVPVPYDDERRSFPKSIKNPISRAYFLWLIPLLNVGYRRTVQPDDLYKLTDDLAVRNYKNRFQAIFQRRIAEARRKHRQKCTSDEEADSTFVVSKFVCLFSIYETWIRVLLHSAILTSISVIISSLIPLLTKQLIKFVEARSTGAQGSVGPGVGYAIGLFLMASVSGLFVNHGVYKAFRVGVQVRSVLTALILEKSFRLSPRSHHQFASGDINSLMGTDLARLEVGMIYQTLIIALPIPLAVSIAILVINIGVSAVIGIVVFLAFIGAISGATTYLFKLRKTVSGLTDKRVSLIREALNNIKMIKFYSWETPYWANILAARAAEMKVVFKIQALRNIINALALSLIGLTSMVAFLSLYAIEGGTRTAADIFSSVSSFELLGFLIFLLPQCLSTTADVLVACKRVGKFLDVEEIGVDENYHHFNDPSSNKAIQLKQATFEWEIFEDEKTGDSKEKKSGTASPDIKLTGKKDTFQLKNVDFTINKGEFFVVTGKIGSGKSSLLQAMSGFMKTKEGQVEINGSLLFSGAPWIQNATIRENITFGLEYDPAYYKEVISACSLQDDFDSFAGGDLTEVGEKGINLSGGQKARINLARSVYANKDIILMDDCLSAVDARVGKHIVQECLLKLLGDKTRILATHQLSLISSANRVAYLSGDGTVDVGTLEELEARNSGFKELLSSNVKNITEDDSTNEKSSLNDDDISIEELPIEEESDHSRKSQTLTKRRVGASTDVLSIQTNDSDDNLKKGKLVEKEEQAVNSLRLEVYKTYLKYGSGKFRAWGFFLVFIPLMCISTFADIFTNTWLSFWVSHKFPGLSDATYQGIYSALVLSWLIFLTIEFVSLIGMTTNASKILNVVSIKRILHAPMSFIDTNPMGRIMNRFTKDTDALDNEISEQLRLFVYGLSRLVGMIILNIIYLPWIALLIPIMAALFIAFANYYQASCREIRRIEAVQRSFVYNTFNETLSGNTTIRAYKSEGRFSEKCESHLDRMNEAGYTVWALQRFLNIGLDTLANIVALVISLLCVNRVFKINAATAGLLVSYSLQLGPELTQLIRSWTMLENDMNAAERLCQYALHLPQEADHNVGTTSVEAPWPNRGEIEFDKVSFSYRQGLPHVLKELSFKVNSGERIGICGRTGAGKSSIMNALYRLNELADGKIFIDGVDISTIGLSTLRSNLSIIPQDPALFTGSIRRNLDPFDEHPDSVLWDALRRAGLIEETELDDVKVQQKDLDDELHKFHLQQEVEEEGINFSLGERQLIAFARALVRNSKILILDEATSSVDYGTDDKIQRTIVNEFKDCTILCIAHRLKTIISYDRILTLDHGEVKELDTPQNLFRKPDGIFRAMCLKSGITESDF